MVAARLATMQQGSRTDLKPEPTLPGLPANLPEVSQTAAADMLNASERTVKAARTDLDQGAKLPLETTVERAVTSA